VFSPFPTRRSSDLLATPCSSFRTQCEESLFLFVGAHTAKRYSLNFYILRSEGFNHGSISANSRCLTPPRACLRVSQLLAEPALRNIEVCRPHSRMWGGSWAQWESYPGPSRKLRHARTDI